MLTLTQEVYDAVVDHALGGAPEEACGVLGGEFGDETRQASVVQQAENAAAEPQTTYRVDPEEQFELMENIESAGLDVVGFYHSHPAGPARPSPTDRARANWPGYSYLIVLLTGTHPFVGSWRWTGEEFEPEVVALR